jgi:hypothetical protein
MNTVVNPIYHQPRLTRADVAEMVAEAEQRLREERKADIAEHERIILGLSAIATVPVLAIGVAIGLWLASRAG